MHHKESLKSIPKIESIQVALLINSDIDMVCLLAVKEMP